MDAIHFILTGGTIEKSYDPLTEKPEFLCQSILPDYLDRVIKAYPESNFEVVCQIDSFEMNDKIRANIVDAIKVAQTNQVIIIHGTSTMAQTAQYLSEHLKGIDKTVILTGAMIPLKEFAMSDGGFNLGYAIAQVQNTEAGVYVAMNARLFSAGDVDKNTEIGRFELV